MRAGEANGLFRQTLGGVTCDAARSTNQQVCEGALQYSQVTLKHVGSAPPRKPRSQTRAAVGFVMRRVDLSGPLDGDFKRRDGCAASRVPTPTQGQHWGTPRPPPEVA